MTRDRQLVLVISALIAAAIGATIGVGLRELGRSDSAQTPEIQRLDRVCDFVRSATSDAADLAESDQPERREAGIVTLKLIKNALTECVR